LSNTKRLGRYHHVYTNNNSTNNNNDNSSSQSYFNELASLCKENYGKSIVDWSKSLFGSKRTSLQKILENANKTIEKSTKFLNKVKSRQLACAIRAKSKPENATIRKEYIKCGKQMCELKHGPYYYAYWKDPESRKLKKKYIGDHMPKDKELNDYSTNNQVL
jgi:archaellin